MAGNTKAKTKVFWVCVIARPWRAAVWFGPGTLAVLIYIFLSRPFCPSRVFAIIQQKSFSKIREVSLYFSARQLRILRRGNPCGLWLSAGWPIPLSF